MPSSKKFSRIVSSVNDKVISAARALTSPLRPRSSSAVQTSPRHQTDDDQLDIVMPNSTIKLDEDEDTRIFAPSNEQTSSHSRSPSPSSRDASEYSIYSFGEVVRPRSGTDVENDLDKSQFDGQPPQSPEGNSTSPQMTPTTPAFEPIVPPSPSFGPFDDEAEYEQEVESPLGNQPSLDVDLSLADHSTVYENDFHPHSPGYSPASPGYSPTSPSYSPTSPQMGPVQPRYSAAAPVYSLASPMRLSGLEFLISSAIAATHSSSPAQTSHAVQNDEQQLESEHICLDASTYSPTPPNSHQQAVSPDLSPASPTYSPTTPTWVHSTSPGHPPTSRSYSPTTPHGQGSSLRFVVVSSAFAPGSPLYSPISPYRQVQSPKFAAASPASTPNDTRIPAVSPAFVPSSSLYSATSPYYSPTSPKFSRALLSYAAVSPRYYNEDEHYLNHGPDTYSPTSPRFGYGSPQNNGVPCKRKRFVVELDDEEDEEEQQGSNPKRQRNDDGPTGSGNIEDGVNDSNGRAWVGQLLSRAQGGTGEDDGSGDAGLLV